MTHKERVDLAYELRKNYLEKLGELGLPAAALELFDAKQVLAFASGVISEYLELENEDALPGVAYNVIGVTANGHYDRWDTEEPVSFYLDPKAARDMLGKDARPLVVRCHDLFDWMTVSLSDEALEVIANGGTYRGSEARKHRIG